MLFGVIWKITKLQGEAKMEMTVFINLLRWVLKSSSYTLNDIFKKCSFGWTEELANKFPLFTFILAQNCCLTLLYLLMISDYSGDTLIVCCHTALPHFLYIIDILMKWTQKLKNLVFLKTKQCKMITDDEFFIHTNTILLELLPKISGKK